MKDMRIRVAAGLMVGVLSLLGAVNSASATAAATVVRYECDPRQKLIVARSEESAAVQFVDRKYELERRPSSIGEKYASANATLIIDGSHAVFVADDRLQLGTCREGTEVASSH